MHLKNNNHIIKKQGKHILLFTLIICLLCSQTLANSSNQTQTHWSEPEIISIEETYHSYRARLAIDSKNTVHIAWKDDSNYNESGSDWDVLYRYKKQGEPWSTPEVVSTESIADCSCLSLAIDAYDTIHIVWKDRSNYDNSGDDSDIFYKYKQQGSNWTQTEVLSTESTDDCNCPTIAIDNQNTIHVAWPDETNYMNSGPDYDIFYKTKPLGKPWTPTEIISTESNTDSFDCTLDTDTQGNIHAVWEEKTIIENKQETWNIIYKQKQGDTWSNSMTLSEDCNKNSVDPKIKLDTNNNIHVIWKDQTNYLHSGYDYDVFYRTNKNNTWSTIEVLSTESTSSINWPSLELGLNNSLHVSWADRTNFENTDNDYDIIYKYKYPNQTWSPLEVVSTESTFESNWPSFAINTNGTIHMSWWDDINGSWVIYYTERDNIYDTYQTNNNNYDTVTDGFETLILLASLTLFSITYMLIKKRK